jgi:dephospho-CoA kinase
MAFEYAVALTGSIGTGKSTAAQLFSEEGFHLIDADRIAHEILDAQQRKIGEMFGPHLVAGGSVDRKALGSVVFSDKEKREALEALLHPLIYDEIAQQAAARDELKYPYFIDIPLFFEGGRYPIEKSVLVYTPRTVQLQRLMQRDGHPEEEALRRMALQMDIEKKCEHATYIIDNSGDLQQLQQECRRVQKEILGDFK